jgi:hypothetical protein
MWRRDGRSRPVSRVLSREIPWAIIPLGLPSPSASSDLPESTAGHGIAFLFGLAPGGVYLAAECCHLRGALLPHLFTLTWPQGGLAVCFLLHFPWTHVPQALPGTLPCGARTFLPATVETATERLPGRLPRYCRSGRCENKGRYHNASSRPPYGLTASLAHFLAVGQAVHSIPPALVGQRG